ncbi:hypothetical protein ACN42_g6615, partial [Penicillium freii]
MSPLWG